MGNDIKYLETKTEKFPFIYSLNVMEAIQKEYGSMKEWSELVEPKDGSEPSIGALLFFFKEAINEGIDIENEKNNDSRKFVNEKKVGRIISEVGMAKAGEQLKASVISANDIDEGTEEIKN